MNKVFINSEIGEQTYLWSRTLATSFSFTVAHGEPVYMHSYFIIYKYFIHIFIFFESVNKYKKQVKKDVFIFKSTFI